MRKTISFFFLTAVIFLPIAHEALADCGYNRLDDPGKPMHDVAVRDQLGVGICYACAATELIDALRLSLPPPRGDRDTKFQTSPIDAAVGTTVGLKRKSIVGGQICGAMDYLKSSGSCSNSAVLKKMGEDPASTAELEETETVSNLSPSDLVPPHPGDSPRACGLDTTREFQATYSLARQLPEPLVQTTNPVQLQNLLAGTCAGAAHKAPDSKIRCSPPVTSHFKESLNDHFSQPGLVEPVGIGFCSSVLLGDESYRGLASDQSETSDCKPHAALVIGQRNMNGKCQFLIRNSWGTTCAPYPHWECDRGNIWVDADVLSTNTMDLNYVE